ncbi:hypothetical protein S-MbCM7_208 [Synechococcus phage ACG-2014h]|uniref:Uncharacterized protein n=1 Tax=Synechococcus phage ACG-2014h TaxID=1340810 RepID=V5USW4_9CAUD|nr:hypothetical protein S-MbCM7_208 [Synechococcus phage ACG-2014h]AHB80622.1 hypothetical protein S-MbCM7_208 [Synechococcus phage ACG-2014h]
MVHSAIVVNFTPSDQLTYLLRGVATPLFYEYKLVGINILNYT